MRPSDLKEPGRIIWDSFKIQTPIPVLNPLRVFGDGFREYHSQRYLWNFDVHSGLRASRNNSSAFEQNKYLKIYLLKWSIPWIGISVFIYERPFIIIYLSSYYTQVLDCMPFFYVFFNLNSFIKIYHRKLNKTLITRIINEIRKKIYQRGNSLPVFEESILILVSHRIIRVDLSIF